MFSILQLVFLAVFAIVTVRTIRHVLRQLGGTLGNVSLAQLSQFSRLAHERAGEYLRANYSGDPAQLPQALGGLLSHVRELSRQQGLQLDDGLLKNMLAISVAKHRVASREKAQAAFARVS